jgi:hypothetical protein
MKRDLIEGFHIEHAGVIDDRINLPEGLYRCLNESLRTLLRGNGDVMGNRTASGALNLGDNFIGRLMSYWSLAIEASADIVDNHRRSPRCKSQRIFASQTAASTGHHHHPSVVA